MSVAVTASPVWGQPPFGPQKRKRALSDSSTFSLRSFTSSSSYTAPHQPAASTSGFVIVDGQLVGSRARPITAEPAATSVKEGPAGEGRKKKPRPKKYHCTWEGCGKSYTRPVRLQEHERSHTNERPFVCSDCGASYRRDTHLAAHIRTHQSEADKPLLCAFQDPLDPSAVPCARRFWTQQHLNVHREGVHEGKKGQQKYPCPLCEHVFIKHHQLRSHHAAAHCSPDTRPFICQRLDCSRSFATGSKLRKHEKTHDSHRYLCTSAACEERPLDERSFQNWTALQRHTREEHPLTCPREGCERRTFKSARALRDHEARHDGVPSQNIESVHRRAHPASDSSAPASPVHLVKPLPTIAQTREPVQRSFQCTRLGDAQEPCTRAFKSASALQSHVNESHLGIRPFICTHDGCDYAAGRRHTLNRHVKAVHRQIGEGEDNEVPRVTKKQKTPPSTLELLTGYRAPVADTSDDPYPCPFVKLLTLAGVDAEGNPTTAATARDGCTSSFSTVDDVHRHLKDSHGMEVEANQVEAFLAEDLA